MSVLVLNIGDVGCSLYALISFQENSGIALKTLLVY